MKMNKRNISGFSLLELVITVAISAILAIGVGMILVSAHVAWIKSSKEIAISEDLRYVQKRIGYQLRGATSDPIGIFDSGKKLRFITAQGTNEVWLNGDAIVYTLGSVNETIVRDVQNFTVSFAGSGPILGSAPYYGYSNPHTRAVRFEIVVSTTTNYATNAGKIKNDSFIIKTRDR